MSQCVPSWDVEDPPINPSPHRLSPSSPPHPQLLPMSDYEVAELTWVNGQLSAQGLVKPTPRYPASAAGTLESVVDQANKLLHPSTVVPSNIHHPTGGPVAATGAVDALVPTQRSLQCDDMASGIEGRKRARVGSRDSMAAHCATDNDEFGFGVSGSRDTENTSFGGGGGAATGGSKTTMDDHHSACHSRRSLSQMEASGDDDEKVIDGGTLRSTISTKRSTAAAIHNQSERKRRDKINQKMRTLQKLVPNSCKTDKASMLDEVIEYLKQLQAQVQMMSRMSSIPTHPMNMMMPMGMQQYQLTMMAQMAQIAQMGMGMGLGFMADMGSSLVRPHTGPVGAAAIPQVLQPPSAAAFLPVVGGGSAWDHPAVTAERMQPLNGGVAVMPDSFLAFLACPTQQPMTMDAYQRMAASYQQMFKQNQNSTNPK